jgi:hypothetical protein
MKECRRLSLLSQNMMDDQEAPGTLPHPLGTYKATYKRQFFIPSKLLGVSFIVGLFLCPTLMIALLPFIENRVILEIIPPFVIAGLLLLECILIFYRNRKLCVFVYDYGLIHRGHESLTTIYWKNVHSVEHTLKNGMWNYDGLEPAVQHIYTVHCTDGTVLRLDETFARLQHLGKSIETGVAQQRSLQP